MFTPLTRNWCVVCGKGFLVPSKLTEHVRVHSGEQPFACEVAGCGKRFTEKGSLTKHQRRIHGLEPRKKKRVWVPPVAAGLAGVSGATYHAREIHYVANDTRSYDIAARCAYLIGERLASGVPFDSDAT